MAAKLWAKHRVVVWTSVKRWSLRGLSVMAISLLSGEIVLRLIFWEGMSFSTHAGPLVRRFERGFVFNRYDGPSRGPEVKGPKAASYTRILIQGDSVTWGQGVKSEHQLYSYRLIERLQRKNLRVEGATLAYGGREIDGHLDQLLKWGAEIDPDIIIYQWFINDIELDKTRRPSGQPFWRGMFWHRLLASISAFWFFLDYSAGRAWPTNETYEEYIDSHFASGTAGWNRFEEIFALWAAEARRLTPRVLVALYPRVDRTRGMLHVDVHKAVHALCLREQVKSIELFDEFRDLGGEYRRLWASPYDAHPSALAHELIAVALEARLRSLWPNVVQ